MRYLPNSKRKLFQGTALAAGMLTLLGCSKNPSNPSLLPTITPAAGSSLTIQPATPPAQTVTPSPAETDPEAPTATPTEELSPVTPLPTATPVPEKLPTEGDVSFSESGHFFSGTISVALSISTTKSGYITYTLDGTEPTKDSSRYTGPLTLAAGGDSFPNAYSIRARAWYTDGSSSDTYVHTYFVSTTIQDRYSTVVFSINGNPAELSDGPDGILYGENYKERGRDSERVVHIEAISPEDTLLFSQFAGVRVFGGSSREHAVKSLKLFARKEYEKGKGSFAADLFGSVMADGTTPVQKYDKLVLRNGGDDFQSGFLRDELLQRLAVQAGFSDYEAVIPAVAYLNGSYYGYYWLHESYCNKYFQNKYGKKSGTYVVLEGSETHASLGGDEEETAAAKEYNALYKKYAYSDLTNDATYQKLCELVDVENYMDYMAYNIYVANYDWPQGNYRLYRYYADEGTEYDTSGPADGRWRYLLHDMDIGLGNYQSTEDGGSSRNDIKAVLGNPSDKRYAPLLAHLLKREDCRDYFIRRILSYMNGALSYDSITAELTAICEERDQELSYFFEHLQELKNTTEDIYARPALTESHLERIRTFAKLRPAYLQKYLEDFFHISLEDYQ